jgi:thiol peroxidase
LATRAIVVLDKSNKVVYTQLINEIADEPDYASALAALKK